MADPDITPTDLKFRFQLGKTLPATITIHNPSTDKLAFKVKTTTPKKYCVRPSAGTVDPKSTASIQVVMQAQKELPPDYANCKDKFLVQTVQLSPEEEINTDTFRKDIRKEVKEAKLRVILEGPAAPPSPVPEENEEDTKSEPKEKPSFQRIIQPLDVKPAVERTAAVQAPAPSNDVLPKQFEAVKVQLDKVTRERDELKKKLDLIELQKVGAAAVPASAGTMTASKSSSASFRLSLIQLVLVAIFAFLMGHYLP